MEEFLRSTIFQSPTCHIRKSAGNLWVHLTPPFLFFLVLRATVTHFYTIERSEHVQQPRHTTIFVVSFTTTKQNENDHDRFFLHKVKFITILYMIQIFVFHFSFIRIHKRIFFVRSNFFFQKSISFVKQFFFPKLLFLLL